MPRSDRAVLDLFKNAIGDRELSDHPVALGDVAVEPLDGLALFGLGAAPIQRLLPTADELITPAIQRLLRNPGTSCDLCGGFLFGFCQIKERSSIGRPLSTASGARHLLPSIECSNT